MSTKREKTYKAAAVALQKKLKVQGVAVDLRKTGTRYRSYRRFDSNKAPEGDQKADRQVQPVPREVPGRGAAGKGRQKRRYGSGKGRRGT